VATRHLLLGDQLFDGLPGIAPEVEIVMIESLDLCTRVRHHQQKVVLFLSGMRHMRDRLRRGGRTVHYVELNPDDPRPFRDQAAEFSPESCYEPADPFAREALCGLRHLPNPNFLTTDEDWAVYRGRHKRLRMADFYVEQRGRLGLLIEPNGEPTGGRWSFDEDNRKKLPKSVIVPPRPWPVADATTREVVQVVERVLRHHPGKAADFCWPVTHEEAAEWLSEFLEHRLDRFGDYEDALSQRDGTLFHSLITPMLNIGLLLPGQVLDLVFERHRRRPAPLNSLEGFVRQVIGWREFIKKLDQTYTQPTKNHFGHGRKLGPSWWDGTTGLMPLDLSIRRAEQFGWIHHIERLMVVGAAMLMCEVAPDEAYRWFMEMTLDSADWVMAPNVFGMSQFADGGLFATKPYLSGSNYLRKMSDYPAGPWEDVWDGLFWRFMKKNEAKLASNHRLGMLLSGFDRIPAARRERILSAAEGFIETHTERP
jgi:deoxyribodipyrimidine photolyase-related protein